ncbi:CDP-6-deoxy-delta-3,4-glucoseen reductase [Comamonas sp.]|uniref:CDP-6-deoxy-delta-3,4-glucoseen reductase n=1 Tax=Comamonas sp. TaxID=34028 RepID=UPI002897863E|nr:CDP-6-deoxy-delta-3,4-glucoseen reductase [Comamonas sp.]
MSSSSSAFQISVLPSGRAFATQASEAILTAAIRSGVGLPYGCKDGACSSCKCKKLSGTVVHGPHSERALSPQEEADGMILPCCAVPTSDVVIESRHVTDESAFPIKKMPVRVQTIERLSPDVVKLRLQLPAADSFRYHAGQYIEFLLAGGTRRAYSMAIAPHHQDSAPGLELHIRHTPGGLFTDHVFGAMKEREILRIEGPFGSFFLHEGDKPMVFLASGTGFAPIKALIEHLQHHDIQRPVVVYWGGRRPQDLYMHDWMLARSAEMPQLRYVPVVSDALAEDAWQGRSGFVHQAVLDDFADLSGYEVYACGAPIVVDSARASFTSQRGLPEDAFFADAFVTEADKQNQIV